MSSSSVRVAIGSVPGRHLEQPEKGRQRLRLGPCQQDWEDRQALRVVVRSKMTVKRRLRLGADPARTPSRPTSTTKAPHPVHRLLQPVEPQLTRADAARRP